MSGQTSSELWEKFRVAGELDYYDRFWRRPLVEDDLLQITSSNADLPNVCNYINKHWSEIHFLKIAFRGVILDVVLLLLFLSRLLRRVVNQRMMKLLL
jgi:hypothetical protein